MLTFVLFILTAAIGFMMAFLYKNAQTTLQALSPKPHASFRIFIWVFVGGIGLVYGMGWYALHLLRTNPIAEDAKLQFNNWYEMHTLLLPLLFFVLTLLSNAYSQSQKKLVWPPYLLTFLFYAILLVRDVYVLSSYYNYWLSTNGLVDENIDPASSSLWVKLVSCFCVTAFNAGVIWWGLKK